MAELTMSIAKDSQGVEGRFGVSGAVNSTGVGTEDLIGHMRVNDLNRPTFIIRELLGVLGGTFRVYGTNDEVVHATDPFANNHYGLISEDVLAAATDHFTGNKANYYEGDWRNLFFTWESAGAAQVGHVRLKAYGKVIPI